jgi:hypothetical protein
LERVILVGTAPPLQGANQPYLFLLNQTNSVALDILRHVLAANPDMADRFNSSTSNNNEMNDIESREKITDDESRLCETIKDRNLVKLLGVSKSAKFKSLMGPRYISDYVGMNFVLYKAR